MVSDFHQSAFVIQQPTAPAIVSGNSVVSDNEQAVIVLIDGKPADIGDNKLTPAAEQKSHRLLFSNGLQHFDLLAQLTGSKDDRYNSTPQSIEDR